MPDRFRRGVRRIRTRNLVHVDEFGVQGPIGAKNRWLAVHRVPAARENHIAWSTLPTAIAARMLFLMISSLKLLADLHHQVSLRGSRRIVSPASQSGIRIVAAAVRRTLYGLIDVVCFLNTFICGPPMRAIFIVSM